MTNVVDSLIPSELFKHKIKVASGLDLQSSLDGALDEMRRRVNGFGGVIGVDHRGDAGVAFSTERMPWVIARCGDALKWGIEPGQLEVIKAQPLDGTGP